MIGLTSRKQWTLPWLMVALALAGCAHAAPQQPVTAPGVIARRPPPPRPDSISVPSYYVPTRILAPVITPGWTTGADFDAENAPGSEPVETIALEAKRNATGLTRAAYYHRDGIDVSVDEADLLYPGALGELSKTAWAAFNDGKHAVISIFVSVRPLKSALVDLDRISLRGDCGPGVAMDAANHPRFRRLDYRQPHYRVGLMWGLPWGANTHNFALLIDGDPHTIQKCTLHLADALRLKSGGKIPDLPLAVTDGLHDTRVFEIRNATPPRKLAAR